MMGWDLFYVQKDNISPHESRTPDQSPLLHVTKFGARYLVWLL